MKEFEHVIVGTGFGGLCLAAQLKMRGESNFILLEKENAVGGTWRDNTYPGAECDIPSALYSYSFFGNPNWKHKWSDQSQIVDYINLFTDQFRLRDHIHYGHEVESASYNEYEKKWTVQTSQAKFKSRFVTFAVGQLHHPSIPQIEGLDSFKGEIFHSAQWPKDYDFAGKSVAVVGNAASAVQLVPEVRKVAKQVSVYQRSPNWCLPKPNREYSQLEKKMAERFPAILKMYRFGLWLQGEILLYGMIRGRWPFTKLGEWVAKAQIKSIVKDPILREKLIPQYPIGAKRILFATDYFKALNEENLDLIDAKIKSINESGICVEDQVADEKETQQQHDAIVFATGFHTNPFLMNIDITGKNDTKLSEHWSQGASAYLGVQTAKFPNMFMIYGPNTNTGHTSVVGFIEGQCQMIIKLINHADKRGASTSITVTEQAENTFNQEIQARLKLTAWDKIKTSWYKVGDRITNNWPGSSVEYRQRTKKLELDHFIFD